MKRIFFVLVLFAIFATGNVRDSFAQSPSTDSADSIRKKVQEKVQETLNSPRAYVGTITDISESTIQINKVTMGTANSKPKEIQQISVKSDTVFVKIGKDTKTVKFSELAIGDWVIAMGFVNSNNVLEARRVLITDPIKPTIRRALQVRVEAATKNKLTVKNISGDTITLTASSNASITTTKNGKIIKIKLTDIDEGSSLIVVGTLDGSTFEARRIHLLEVVINPTTKPSPSPKSSPEAE